MCTNWNKERKTAYNFKCIIQSAMKQKSPRFTTYSSYDDPQVWKFGSILEAYYYTYFFH